MTLPRRHHYVWRHYLEAWEVDGLLQASRNGGPVFSSSAANVALQRDFYRLPKLQTRDVEFIREVIERMALTPEGKRQLVREESRWAQLVNAIGRVMKPASAPGGDE